MTVFYILLGVAGFIALVALLPVTVRAGYDGGPRAEVRVGGLRVYRYPPKKKRSEKAMRRAEKAARKEAESADGSTPGGKEKLTAKKVLAICRLVKEALKRLKLRLRVRTVECLLVYGGGDAAKTAVTYGELNAACLLYTSHADKHEHDKHCEHHALVFDELVVPAVGQNERKNPRPVQRRDGQQIEHAQHAVEIDAVIQEHEHMPIRLHKRRYQAEYQPENTGQRKVGQRSHERNNGAVPFWIAEVEYGNGHSAPPAESEQEHTHRADRVQMLERIEGNAALQIGGVVPKPLCRIGVAELVHRDRENQDRGIVQKVLYCA